MLGKRLEAVRSDRGYGLEELARRTGLSEDFLSRIESEEEAPSIAVLKKITEALDASIGELFEEDPGDQVYFAKRDDRAAFEVVKDRVTFEFGASRVPDPKMQVIFLTVRPGGGSEGEYTHEGEEFGTVLEGTLLFELAGREYRMEPGDSIYFRSSIPHRWSNPGGGTVRALWVITPPTF